MNRRESEKEARKCNNAGTDNNTWKGEENSPQGRRTIKLTTSERQKKDKDTKKVDSKINK
jgi:hypothetical protein